MNKEKAKIIIYTDGSSRGNPGPGGFAFVAIYPNATGELRVDEEGGREVLTTNNRMEMMAVIAALKFFDNYYDNHVTPQFEIRLDSAYVLNGATKWIHGWKSKNWITAGKEEVKNVDLWQKIDQLLVGKKISWVLLKGHSEIYGNERADVIATEYADGVKPQLFSGFLTQYPEAEEILNIKSSGGEGTKKNKKSKSSNSKLPAHSYVSMVDGKINIDKTWDECKARVHKTKGALYKKSISESDERSIISEFNKNS